MEDHDKIIAALNKEILELKNRYDSLKAESDKKITELEQAEKDRQAHLHFLKCIDQINHTLHGSNDIEQMMSNVLDEVLSIFDCDRAGLLYPCDPNAPFWKVSMERTKPEYPGANVPGAEIPMDDGIREVQKMQLASDGPVQYGPGTPNPLSENVANQFDFKCFMSMAIYPKIGSPWQFAIHQCSYPRIWTPEEERLLQEIGRRLEDALASMLSYRNLEETEERYRTLYNVMDEGVAINEIVYNDKDDIVDYVIIDINPAFSKILNFPREQVVGNRATTLYQMSSQYISDWWKKHAKMKEAVHAEYYHPVIERWFHVITTPPNGKRFATFTQDITERKNAELLLKEKQNLLLEAQKIAHIGNWWHDLTTGEIFWSDGFFRILGIKPQKPTLELGFSLIHPDDRAILLKDMEDTDNVDSKHEQEFRIIRPNGEIRWIHNQWIGMFDTDGKEIKRVGVHQDITERKLAEISILESEHLFRALVENSPDFIARYDLDYRRIYVNPAIQKLFKNSDKKIIGQTPAENSPIYAPQIYISNLQKVIETSSETTEEIPFLTTNNEMHWGQIRFVPEFDQDRKVSSVLTIGRDIHEIKENERHFRMLAENFPDFVIRFNSNFRYIYTNPAVEKAFGKPSKSFLNKTIAESPLFLKSNQNKAVISHVRQVFKNGETCDFELLCDTPFGVQLLEFRLIPEKDAAEKVVSVLFIARDITERKKAEKTIIEKTQELKEAVVQLERSQNMLQLIIESIPVRVFWKDTESRFVGCNSLFARDAGFENPEQLIGKDDFGMGWKEQAEIYRADDRQVIETKCPKMNIEEPQTTPQGKNIWLKTSKVPLLMADGEVFGILGVYEDITDRKLSEEALLKSEESYRRLTENAPDMIFRMSIPDGKYEFVSAIALSIFGYSPEEFYKNDSLIKQIIHPDWQNYFQEQWKNLLNGEMPPTYEYQFIHKSGKVGWVNQRNILIRDDAGNPVAIEGIVTDITERVMAEKGLKKSEARFKDLFNRAAVPLCLINKKDGDLIINLIYEETFGYSPQEIPTLKEWWELAYPDPEYRKNTIARCDAVMQKAVANQQDLEPIEYSVTCKNGSIRDMVVYGSAIGDYYLLTFFDVTQRKQAEDALNDTAHLLSEAQRLAHIGSWELDLITNKLIWSDEIFKIFEIDSNKFGATYEAFLDAIHPDDRETVNSAYTNSLMTKSPYVIDHRLLLPDGRVKFVHEQCETFYDEDKPIRSIGTVQDITDRKNAEHDRITNLKFFESMDQINRALQGTNDLEKMMGDVLDVMLSIFDCDRAGLISPCDPNAPAVKVQMERTRPEYSGFDGLELEIPMDEGIARVFKSQLSSEGVVKYGPGADKPLPKVMSEKFGFKSLIALALLPKIGSPWLFAMQQCSYARIWTPEEEQLFHEIGIRLTDALTGLM